MPKHSMAVPLKQKTSISRSFLFLCVGVAVALGFVAGTRSRDIIGAVAPLIGVKVETGTLDLDPVQKTYQALKANFDGQLDDQALIDGASRGMVAAAGDKYTMFFDAKEAADFNKDISGDIGGGIGAEIATRHDQPTIIRILPGNPAEKAGLKQGDVVVAINDESTDGWSASKAADAIRGEVGTSLKLKVRRGATVKEFSITRDTVSNPSVQSSIKDGIGYLTISRFDSDTGTLAKQAADQFKSKHVSGVILDLRGNGGGYLTDAQTVAGLWVSDKVVVSERTGGKETDRLKSDDDAPLAGVKTVVLVDGNSASASEIVAGALQDYHKATLIGAKTFGKGTVQKLLNLGAGTELKVTVARWYTPNGRNINGQGLTPDKTVTITDAQRNSGDDPQLAAAKQLFD